MDIQLTALFYLFLRLAPFILVSYFTLSSVFHSDLKGFVYLIGLLVTTIIGSALSSFLPMDWLKLPGERDFTCDFLDITKNSRVTYIPVGSGIITYTLGYLLYTIVKYGTQGQNWPTITFLSVLSGIDLFWQFNHSCYQPIILILTIVAFGLLGVLWSYLIDETKRIELQYFNSPSGKESCSRPASNTFRCDVYKNGKLISTH